MPTFFTFQQGNESRHPPPPDSLYGRFRLLPDSVFDLGGSLTSYGTSKVKGSSERGGRMKGIFSIFRRNDRAMYRESMRGRLAGGNRYGAGSNTSGYGAIVGSSRDLGQLVRLDQGDSESVSDAEDERWWWIRYIVAPRKGAVRKIMEDWWSRFVVLVVLPAGMTILWCAVPFPTYPLGGENALSNNPSGRTRFAPMSSESQGSFLRVFSTFLRIIQNLFLKLTTLTIANDLPAASAYNTLSRHNNGVPGLLAGPGHGEALVRIDFWYFLCVYYGFYNFVGLMWITKLFNLYSLNWWPPRLGFPISYTIFWSLSLLVTVPLYLHSSTYSLLSKNLTWIFLTFVTMCCPLVVAALVLASEQKHISLRQRHILSEVQLLFSPAPIVGNDSYHYNFARRTLSPTRSEPNYDLDILRTRSFRNAGPHRYYCIRGLPSSYIRFLWFCLTLLLSLLAFVLGEAYAELYLRTLPHNNIETVIYVYTWIATIHSLDALTGWILGTNSSGKVGSYPLSFVFKFYFSLTYQVYVRALYARLRSPSQFAVLQLLSSAIVVVYQPLSMTRAFHDILRILNLNGQTYEEYKKFVGRSFYLRGLAENVSMLAWLGWVVVLHYGKNKNVYPYFAFESETGGWWPSYPGHGPLNSTTGLESKTPLTTAIIKEETYTFELTFFASMATWACEIAAGWIVRRVMAWAFEFEVTEEAKRDFLDFPELVGAVVAVGVHVGQNMLVSILRMKF